MAVKTPKWPSEQSHPFLLRRRLAARLKEGGRWLPRPGRLPRSPRLQSTPKKSVHLNGSKQLGVAAKVEEGGSVSPETDPLASKPQMQNPRDRRDTRDGASACLRLEGLVARRLGAWVWSHTA